MAEILKAGSPGSYAREREELLAAAAMMAAEVSDLPDLLKQLAVLTLEPTGADRVSFFLIDHPTATLHLWAAAVATDNGPEGFREGLSMDPIPIDGLRAERLSGTAVAIEDAAASPLVPPSWAEAFGLVSLVAAPLRCGSDVLGVLVVDWAERRSLPQGLVDLIDAISCTSATAVALGLATTRLADHADALQRLLGATWELVSTPSADGATDVVVNSIRELLGATDVLVERLDEDGRNGAARAPRPADPNRVCLPLRAGDGCDRGAIVATVPDASTIPASALELARALASHVAFAFERADLAEQVALGAELANTLLELHELHDHAPEGLFAGLRRAVPATLGFKIVGIRLAGDEDTSIVGDTTGTEFDKTMWAKWRHRRRKPDLVDHEGWIYAPIWHDGAAAGIVWVEPDKGVFTERQRRLLETLASALGEVARQRQLRREIEQRELQLAMAREREQVAWDLHETVAGFLRAIETTAAAITKASDGTVAEEARLVAALSRSGRRELEAAVQATALLDGDAHSLGETLNGLVERLGDLLGADADLQVAGTPRTLPPELQRVLMRVGIEALSRVGRHGRAGGVAVHLEFGPDLTTMTVRDDGIDLGGRESDGDGSLGAHFGLRVLSRRLDEVGGNLRVEHRPPRGLLLVASVPG